MIKKIFITVIVAVALYQLAYYLYSTGRVNEYIDRHPADSWAPQADYYLGMTFILTGKPESGIFRMRRVVSKYNNSITADGSLDDIKANYARYAGKAQYRIARTYEDLSNKPSAIREYQILIENFPDYSDIDLAKRALDFLRG